MQILFASRGLLSVAAAHRVYPVHEHLALTLYPRVDYRVVCRSDSVLHTITLAPTTTTSCARACRSVQVSPLLRAIVLELSGADPAAHGRERQELLAQLLRCEVQRRVRPTLNVRMPGNERLADACRHVVADPTRDISLDALARMACMSRRSFTRQFRQDTGLSFGAWRQQLRMIEALALLDEGRSVSKTAFDVGYSSASAFSTVFRRTFGMLPSEYQPPRGPCCSHSGP